MNFLQRFNKDELKFLSGLGSALALRQLALILISPYIAIYGNQLAGHTPALVGLALGIYGLVHALLQLPFGTWSDKVGRKYMIVLGLFLLSAGMVLAALAKNIYVLIIARVIQGSGAMTSAAYSWLGDTLSIKKRDYATSLMVIFIGGAGIISLVGGPFLYQISTISMMFWVCGGLTFLSMLYVFFFLKKDKPKSKRQSSFGELFIAARDKNLLAISLAGFVIEYIIIAALYMAPIILQENLDPGNFWRVFVPAIILGLIALRIASSMVKRNHFRGVIYTAFSLVMLSSVGFFKTGPYLTASSVILVVISYIMLTALLPINTTKLSNKENRGIYTGFYNTVTVLGAFLGGALTGTLWGFAHYLPAFLIILLPLISIFVTGKIDAKTIQK